MSSLAAGCRVAVGVVLLLAGFTKLRQPAWAAMAGAFGTPRRLVPVVPWTELVIGALLVTGAAGRIPVLAALALLAAFTAAVASRLAAGRRAPCGCFGEASPAPIGPATLVRDVVLLAAALVALGGSASPAPAVVAGAVAGLAFVGLARRR